MSNIHNLTSHLKNTTIIPAPYPLPQRNQHQQQNSAVNGLNKPSLVQTQRSTPTSPNKGLHPRMFVPPHLQVRPQPQPVIPTTLGPNTTLTPTNPQLQAFPSPLRRRDTAREIYFHSTPGMIQQTNSQSQVQITKTPPKPPLVRIPQSNVQNQNQGPYNSCMPNLTRAPPPVLRSPPRALPPLQSPPTMTKRPSVGSGSRIQTDTQGSNSGGAARVQHVDQHRRLSNASSNSNGGTRFVAIRPKPLPPETVVKTEPGIGITPPPKPPRLKQLKFKKGDDVLFTTDDGTFMFGTVGMIHGDTVQILFGDGTQQLASFERVKLLTCHTSDDESSPSDTKKVPVTNHHSKSTKTPKISTTPPQSTSDEVTVACGSCGVVKKITTRKSFCYSPHTKEKFNCRRCINKMKVQTQAQRKGVSASSPSKSPSQLRQSLESNRNLLCFHCEKTTTSNDRLHCNLCERACHLSCLALPSSPMEGDRFWDVICSTCGTQNGSSNTGSSRSKIFSCRRSISSWSDVAHLVLSCLMCRPENKGIRFFDLDNDIIPLIDDNLDRLHLPRQYKTCPPENRRSFLNTALTNASLRFLNGKELYYNKDSLWAIRENRNQPGYSPLKTLQKSTPTPSSPNLRQHNNNNMGVPATPTRTAQPQHSSSTRTGGGSSRTLGQASSSPRSTRLSNAIPGKDVSKQASPVKGTKAPDSARVMSHSLVQKAKKQCQQRKSDMDIESHNKRKAKDWNLSPDQKRVKLSPGSSNKSAVNGFCITPTRKSPIQKPEMSEWLKTLNSARSGTQISPVSDRSSGFSKASGSTKTTPDRPMRHRKPKSFDLKALESDRRKPEESGLPSHKIPLKMKGKTKPSKQVSNLVSQKFAQIPLMNGVTKPPEDEQQDQEPEEFCLLKCPLEELVDYAKWMTVQCLPKIPETESEMKILKRKVAEIYASESLAPPPYLSFPIPCGANNKQKVAKSKKDLNKAESFEITGRWIDQTGSVHYHCEWKDGLDNESSDNDTEQFLIWDDIEDHAVMVEFAENAPLEEENPIIVKEEPISMAFQEDIDISNSAQSKESSEDNDVAVIEVNSSSQNQSRIFQQLRRRQLLKRMPGSIDLNLKPLSETKGHCVIDLTDED